MRKIVTHRNVRFERATADLFARVDRGEREIVVQGIRGTAAALLASLLIQRTAKPVLLICPTEKEAVALEEDSVFYTGRDRVLSFPPWDFVSTDMFTFSREAEFTRIAALCRLLSGEACLVVASVRSLMQRLMPRRDLADYRRTIAIGDSLDRDELVRLLLAGGYTRTTLVEAEGEFSARGHVVDLFSPTAAGGIRIEFVADEIESIRDFDPRTQRSISERVDFTLAPAREIILTDAAQEHALRNLRARAEELGVARNIRDRLAEKLTTGLTAKVNPLLFPLFYEGGGATLEDFTVYLPADTVVVVNDEQACRHAAEAVEEDLNRLVEKARVEERFYLDIVETHLTPASFVSACNSCRRLIIPGLTIGVDEGKGIFFKMDTDLALPRETVNVDRLGERLLAPLAERTWEWLGEGNRVTVVCSGEEAIQRTLRLLKQYGLTVTASGHAPFAMSVFLEPPPGVVEVKDGRITTSLVWEEAGIVLISEGDLFGKKGHRRRFRTAREGYFLKSFGELREGDFVVHKDHGIGRYGGLKKITVEKRENDFLLIEYAEGDRLFIPVDRLDLIQRYVGPEGYVPRVDRLGGPSWEAVKERVKRSIKEVAEELIAVYAAREVLERDAFTQSGLLDEEFAAAFPYEETPDQARAIEDVQADMDRGRPMDRLICGDAGFGKTEVALRAAFRAVINTKQVAVLVPTTILAEQHYGTFRERFRDYPVRVEVLNRLKSRAEQQQIAADLAAGKIDIIIGTHRLLQKDIRFRDLGLVVIDEEQRFGVAHKEQLKKMRTLVDVLTLTATPIPRTLHLSLVGIRDLSIINTPPEDRRPIKTYVVEFEEEIIKEAIRRERERGGRVFFLHDRVRSIYSMARFVEKLVPEARTAVVHGRMKPREIEGTLVKFIRGERDVLVCTTIMGSGVDIPTANTILINRADRFGLSQLYQIRGRVGRSGEEAFAYLLVPKGAMLSPDAARRLQVIMELSEPGSGFRIAANDLELRGAGNLLGVSQSGHVSAVGYELYTELMEKAIAEIRGNTVVEKEEVRPEINLGVSAFIPAEYMADENQRLVTYKKISMAADEEDLQEIHRELKDCYGWVPPEVENLFDVIRIRHDLRPVKGRKLVFDGRRLSVTLSPDSPLEPRKILELARKGIRGIRLTPDYVLNVPASCLGEGPPATQVRNFLRLFGGVHHD